MCGCFCLIIFTIISSPPVVVSILNNTPIAIPNNAPPITEASIKSLVTASILNIAGSASIATDETISEYKVDKRNFFPNFHAPKIIIGTLIIIINTPTPGSIGNTSFNIMAIPEIPPGAN
ncbi:unknown [Eubacterium sp. CAG:192]|nr:unknown [Eubacterium sp. CAG:192]